jgi:pimeloyl-ACP methyl ester carboxylesterase
MNETKSSNIWTEINYSSQDGLRLYARHYPAPADAGREDTMPLICLPGLTRNSKDFHLIASHLSKKSEQPRDVYCIDYRGRGKSEYDANWENYSPYIEMLDVLDFMSLVELHQAAILGTSRGGIIAMLMGVTRPGAVGPVILNDIGPVIEARGLARIIGYVGKTPTPESWENAALIVRDMSSRFFTDVSEEEWLEIAKQWFMEEDGLPVQGYDTNLANTLSEIDLAQPIAQMWEQFDTLKHLPMLVLHGEHSDLLSAETVEQMTVRHPGLERYIVLEEGHAPLLRDSRTINVIDRFLAGSDLASAGDH